MKFINFLCAWISLCQICNAKALQEHSLSAHAIQELMEITGISALQNPIEATQKEWFRKPGQELWELQERPPAMRAAVIAWARKEGLFAPWTPTSKTYDKAFILGASTPLMQSRLAYLVQTWQEGVRFKEIVWLTGDRPLDKRIDQVAAECLNESVAAIRIWNEADLPQAMRELPLQWIAVPLKASGERPNTQDTLLAFLKRFPDPCSCLFVSDQPFCGYQYAVIKGTLPTEFTFDVIGKGVIAPEQHPRAAAIILDAVARWLYQESQNLRGQSG